MFSKAKFFLSSSQFSHTQPIHTLLSSPLFKSLLPSSVRIVEVSPRDGLQAESTIVNTNDKIQFINLLSKCGFKTIEATSFVNPKAVPQMSDALEIMSNLPPNCDHISFPVLVPNIKGYINAKNANAKEVSIFTAGSDTFQKTNTNCTIDESFERFDPIFKAAKEDGIAVRGYISCALGCPYEGPVSPSRVVHLTEKLLEKGCYEVSIGDTIGVASPGTVFTLFDLLSKANIPSDKLAGHFHNTYGQALANILVALNFEIKIFDTSVCGIGGCPFAKGSTGNVATEDVLNLLHSLNIKHDIDIKKMMVAGEFIRSKLGRKETPLERALKIDHPYFKSFF
uniref:hydroxymethylglutaryl-CoA lyase n=1 Tax=Nephromyces sp. MMRI TaxID=2496275 RepID=A0A3S8V335_9APIC|nr:3-hydroxymethyl-3-methylglutaryl-CoA lyase [Nephromyces sp. MMRI]